ncbi:MAG: hypothetical protein Q8R18_04130 [bacterium]|nr:hypothetical protein [bacterium]
MAPLSVSALDDKYIFSRRHLGNIEIFSPVYNPSSLIWEEFSLQKAPEGRIRFLKNKTEETLEEKIQGLFYRVEKLFEMHMYSKASFFLEQVLDLTKNSSVRTEQLYSYRATAHFHLGMLYANPGEEEERAYQHFSEAITLNAELVHLVASEKAVGRLLRSHLELGRVYHRFEKKEKALEKVNHVLALTIHYVDIISIEQYESFTQSARELGIELFKKL